MRWRGRLRAEEGEANVDEVGFRSCEDEGGGRFSWRRGALTIERCYDIE
jgi:hypothetical protein